MLTLGEVILTVLSPPLRSDDQNGNSVGLLLSYGGFEAILPGDATAEEQGWWQDHYRDLLDDVDVYKAAHHGSSTGDRSSFVRLLDPEVVVVSSRSGQQLRPPASQGRGQLQRCRGAPLQDRSRRFGYGPGAGQRSDRLPRRHRPRAARWRERRSGGSGGAAHRAGDTPEIGAITRRYASSGSSTTSPRSSSTSR